MPKLNKRRTPLEDTSQSLILQTNAPLIIQEESVIDLQNVQNAEDTDEDPNDKFLSMEDDNLMYNEEPSGDLESNADELAQPDMID